MKTNDNFSRCGTKSVTQQSFPCLVGVSSMASNDFLTVNSDL